MSAMAQYVLSVTAAAMLAAIVKNLAGAGTMGTLVKLLGGIFMALTILSPILQLELQDMGRWFSIYAADGQAAAAEGEAMADDTFRSIITEQTEAYILDKAACYDADLSANVTLDENGIPVKVILRGRISPYGKAQLSRIIALDLGVKEEAQQWIS